MFITVDKPWGREVILTSPDLPYSGKLLFIKAGHRLSLQYHNKKIETLCLITGDTKLQTGPNKDQLSMIQMEPNNSYTIKPFELHRLIAQTDSLIVEVSTAEQGTTFRLEDDYQRGDESPQIRSLPNRGWQNDPRT